MEKLDSPKLSDVKIEDRFLEQIYYTGAGEDASVSMGSIE